MSKENVAEWVDKNCPKRPQSAPQVCRYEDSDVATEITTVCKKSKKSGKKSKSGRSRPESACVTARSGVSSLGPSASARVVQDTARSVTKKTLQTLLEENEHQFIYDDNQEDDAVTELTFNVATSELKQRPRSAHSRSEAASVTTRQRPQSAGHCPSETAYSSASAMKIQDLEQQLTKAKAMLKDHGVVLKQDAEKESETALKPPQKLEQAAEQFYKEQNLTPLEHDSQVQYSSPLLQEEQNISDYVSAMTNPICFKLFYDFGYLPDQ